ncbi:hypothetical protein BJF79_42880 [Actinomadura sp. CNU-125]|uniref:thioesterase II family protein n=1 Tax=Actinomadura sp. CNU-125 TaxID=1904961 RepID=UPI00095BACAC|nr:alpha/beta fold hydrolase [Actinomadura sp. CNU-125]OLT27060.1 hypothetical protein BJF79_42880 [Actinomadura sp. CNU-125]
MRERPLLFCVPYSGGSARVFRPWRERFAEHAEVVPLELAGRGSRAAEPVPTSVRATAADLARTVRETAAGRPHFLFGHSMGGLVAYEMALANRDLAFPGLRMVVVSGRNPPQRSAAWRREVLSLDDRALLAELRAVGGVPDGLSPSIAAAFFLPLLRADLRGAVSYRPASPPRRISAPLLVFLGRGDALVEADAGEGWWRCTDAGCTVVRHDGHHFTIFERVGELAATLRPFLEAAARPGRAR